MVAKEAQAHTLATASKSARSRAYRKHEMTSSAEISGNSRKCHPWIGPLESDLRATRLFAQDLVAAAPRQQMEHYEVARHRHLVEADARNAGDLVRRQPGALQPNHDALMALLVSRVTLLSRAL